MLINNLLASINFRQQARLSINSLIFRVLLSHVFINIFYPLEKRTNKMLFYELLFRKNYKKMQYLQAYNTVYSTEL